MNPTEMAIMMLDKLGLFEQIVLESLADLDEYFDIQSYTFLYLTLSRNLILIFIIVLFVCALFVLIHAYTTLTVLLRRM